MGAHRCDPHLLLWHCQLGLNSAFLFLVSLGNHRKPSVRIIKQLDSGFEQFFSLRGQVENSTIRFVHFNIYISEEGKEWGRKIERDSQRQREIMNKNFVKHCYIYNSRIQVFSRTYRKFSKTDHILAIKQGSLNWKDRNHTKYDHNRIKFKIDNLMKCAK